MASDFRLKKQLPELTERIVGTYAEVGTTHHLGHCPLPNYDAIIAVTEDLKEILYPGYRRRDRLHLGNVTYHVGDLIDGLHDRLTAQISRALCHDAGEDVDCNPAKRDDFEALGQTKAIAFLQELPELRRLLALDVQAAYDGDPAARSVSEVIYCYPGFYAVTVYRVAHELWLMGVHLMARIMSEHAHSFTGADIHPGATIGKSFFIDHATGVVIGETSIIGNRVKIYQSVTIGAPAIQLSQSARGTKRHPTLEDDVVVYANATLLGGKTLIGKGSVIGGGVFLTASVPPGHFVYNKPQELKYRSAEKLKAIAATHGDGR